MKLKIFLISLLSLLAISCTEVPVENTATTPKIQDENSNIEVTTEIGTQQDLIEYDQAMQEPISIFFSGTFAQHYHENLLLRSGSKQSPKTSHVRTWYWRV
ncbi:hypothetical protein ACFL21_02085 [Patescibacteria group bacterium]